MISFSTVCLRNIRRILDRESGPDNVVPGGPLSGLSPTESLPLTVSIIFLANDRCIRDSDSALADHCAPLQILFTY